MKLQLPAFSLAWLPQRLKGMFNLNDPRWGRSDDKPADNASGNADRPDAGPGRQGGRPDKPSSGCDRQEAQPAKASNLRLHGCKRQRLERLPGKESTKWSGDKQLTTNTSG